MKSRGEADRFGVRLAAAASRRAGQPLPGHALRRRLARGLRGHGPRGLDRPALAGAARGRGPRSAHDARRRGALRLPLAAAVRIPAVGEDDRQRAAGARLGRAPGAAASRRSRPAGWCSARASPSPRRAPTWRRCAPRRGARAIASSCPATRSGPRAPRSRTGSTWRCEPTRTRPRPHRGISVLVADMSSPGIEVREIETVGGGALCEVFLTDVEVPAEPARRRAARRLAGADEHARPRARDEREGRRGAACAGRPGARGGASASDRLELRRLRGEAQAARLLGRRAATLLAEGRPAAADASMAKLSISTLVRRTAEAGARLLGPEALVERGPRSVGDGRLAALTRASAGAPWRAGRRRSSAA